MLAGIGWLLSLALAYSIGGVLAQFGVVLSLVFTGSALATTAIGTLIPVLKDAGEMETRFGTYLLAAGAAGEFGPIMLITIVLSTSSPIHEALILLAFVALAVLLGDHLGAIGLARLAAAGAHARKLEPARDPDRGRARVRAGGAGRHARARPAAGRLCGRHRDPAGAQGPGGDRARVEADGGRLRLPGAVLLRHQRHGVRSRLADRRAPPACSSCRCSSRCSWSCAACRRWCSTAGCSTPASGSRWPSSRRPRCRWWSRSRRSPCPRSTTCARRPPPRWSARRSSRR